MPLVQKVTQAALTGGYVNLTINYYMKDLSIYILTVVIAVVGVLNFVKPVAAPVGDNLGAFPGNDFGQRVVASSGFAQAGAFTIATTASAMTLTNADMSNNASIIVRDMGAGQAALALTLPASTTWTGLPLNGTRQNWIIDNLPATAATTTTVTAGVGVDIDGITANDDVLNGDASGLLSCWRTYNSNVRCVVQEMVDAG